MTTAYRVASVLIVLGFVMLCQPFTHGLFVWGFPLLLCGVILFMILDHIPERAPTKEDSHG
ncbi:hypothetical protein [Tabrizicola sp.]|uniref:hypothetical protein n=1 Tax=Tabrizicola sp. TaxID=2005166 RepID=UPI002FDE8E12